MKLTLSKAFHPPPIEPPHVTDVITALETPPATRSDADVQTIFRHLLMNEQLLKIMVTSDAVKAVALTGSLVKLTRGDVLFQEGDDPDGWYMILQGSIDVIIWLYLIAEDCSFESHEHESTELAQLAERLGLDVSVDRLKRVNVLRPGQIFGQRSYVLEKQRTATIVPATDEVCLIKFDTRLFHETSCLMTVKAMFEVHRDLTRAVFPRLREDQINMVASLAEVIELKAGTTITAESKIGEYLYIVKSGVIARRRVVDFTDLSFRKIDAPFETLELHFPDGFQSVHTDDLKPGALFADPCVRSMSSSDFNVKTSTDVTLVALDLDYFRIVAGSFEIERVKHEIRSTFTDEEVIRIWVADQKKKLWRKFKDRQMQGARSEMRTDREFKSSTVAIRVPQVPTSLKTYKRKKVVPYVSKSLRG